VRICTLNQIRVKAEIEFYKTKLFEYSKVYFYFINNKIK
jgi:hypothetical protein